MPAPGDEIERLVDDFAAAQRGPAKLRPALGARSALLSAVAALRSQLAAAEGEWKANVDLVCKHAARAEAAEAALAAVTESRDEWAGRAIKQQLACDAAEAALEYERQQDAIAVQKLREAERERDALRVTVARWDEDALTTQWAWEAKIADATSRAERAEGRVTDLAALFGIADGAQYLNDAEERAATLLRAETALAEARRALRGTEKALVDLEAHHVDINRCAHRPEEHSATLRMIRSALAAARAVLADEGEG